MFFVIDDMFDRGNAVYQIGDADQNDTVSGIVFSASPGVIFGFFDTFFEGQG